MTSSAHCLYCFEVLAAYFDKSPPPKLHQIEASWARYEKGDVSDEVDPARPENDIDMEDPEDPDEDEDDARPMARTLRPREVARLQGPSSASPSSSSTPSTLSATSLQAGSSSNASRTSSRTSFFSFSRHSPAQQPEEKYPLFVTWNTVSARGHKSLRGCIGTFEAQELSSGLESYALASALDDTRFAPVAREELPSLSASVTLLLNFTPCADPLDWTLGTHGIRISFHHHSRRYGATYLPDVAVEQGWTKEETIVSLMRKAGWSGRSSEWRKVTDVRCVRYQGKKASADFWTWKDWKAWTEMASSSTARAVRP